MVFETIDALLADFQRKLNLGMVPLDQVRLILTVFFIIMPLGFGFQFVNGAKTRHALSIVLGLLIQYFMFREFIITLLAQTILVYVLAKVLQEKCGKPVFITSMAVLFIHHLYFYCTNYGI